VQQPERRLADKIDEAISLANQLCGCLQVINETERKSLHRWIVRWRAIKQRLLNERISE
jgi:hypothetical protein